MSATSFHLKACNVAYSEAHNKREKDMEHTRKDLKPLNESFSYIPHSLLTEHAQIKRDYDANHKKAMYSNAVRIMEGVLVHDEHTTMGDLKKFCEECHQRFGIIPLQIHTHRDEGSYNEETGEWKTNYHTHITFRMYGNKGEKFKLKPQDTSEMQDIAARCLNMERGKKSAKKHLDALEYKIKLREDKLKALDVAIENAESKLSKKGAKGVYNAIRDHLAGDVKKELDSTRKALQGAENTISEQKETIDKLKRGMKSAKSINTRLLEQLNKQTDDIANIENIRAENEQIKSGYAEKEKELQAEKSKVNEEKREVRKILSNVKNNLDDVLKVTSGTSLTTSQAIDIASGKDVEVEDFYHPEHGRVKMSDIEINRNIVMRWNSEKKTLMLRADGRMQKSMYDPVWRTLEDWFKRFKTMLNDIRERSMNWGKSMRR